MRTSLRFLIPSILMLLAPNAWASLVPYTAGSPKVMIGNGWDSRSRVFRENCVQGTANWAGAQQATLFLDHQVTDDKLNEFFEASLAARMNLLFASGELKLSASHQKDSESYMETLLYAVDVHGKDILLTDADLNARGQQVQNDHLYAKEVCGDQLVTRIRTGGQLFIKVDFDFYDEKIRNEWKARFEFSILGISASKSWSDISEDVKRHTFVDFSATQLGGDPTQLDALLKTVDKTRCRLSDLDACSDIINKLLWYSRTEEAGGFRSQVDAPQANGSIDWNRVSILSYEIKPYETQGLRALAQSDRPDLTPMAEAALTQLLDERNHQSDLMDRASLMMESFPLKKAQKDSLKEARDFPLRRNLARIRQVIDACFADPVNCVGHTEDLLGSLEKVDASLFVFVPSFYTQCMGRDTTSDFGRTMTRLLTLAQTNDCLQAEQRLLARTDFDMSSGDLVDLTPLRYLKPQRLNLSYNRIWDLQPLNLATSLLNLNVRDNQIRDIHVAQRWPQLRELNAVFNRIGSVQPLASQTQIKRLALHGNLFRDGDLLARNIYDYLSLYDEDRCALERDRYLRDRKVSRGDYEAYRDMKFAPFVDNGSVRWAACPFALHSYAE